MGAVSFTYFKILQDLQGSSQRVFTLNIPDSCPYGYPQYNSVLESKTHNTLEYPL